FDPAGNGGAGTWASTGSLATTRRDHTATLLPSGKVLVTGGQGDLGILSSSELYNPATGTWASTGSLAVARFQHAATLLPSGKVLVAGGQNGTGFFSSAELYDPAGNGGAGAWTATASLAIARDLHTATLLPSGKVLVAG